MEYRDNRARWNSFTGGFEKQFSSRDLSNIRFDVYAGASPEGPAHHNTWLGENRGQAIARLLRTRYGKVGAIEVHNEGARWAALRSSVASSDEPWRDEVLRILDSSAASPTSALRDPRELQLRQLHGGAVWPVLLERHLAPLRSSGSAIVSVINPPDTVVVHDTVFIAAPVPPVIHDTIYSVPQPDTVRCWKPIVAIKTNVLFDALLAPNLEVEVPLGWSRWSIMAEWWTPWYRWKGNEARHNHAYELLMLGGELRYWFSRREAECPRLLRGHFLGIYVAGGKYDVQWSTASNDHEGWQGEYFSVGATYGYAFHLSRHWRLELSASVGYIDGPQRYYHGMFDDTHLIWQRNQRLNYVGPTKLKVSFGYLIGRNKMKIKK